MPPLTDAQRSALSAVRTRSEGCRAAAQRRIAAVLDRVGEADPVRLPAGAATRGGVAVHFHPDRLATDGRTVVEGLRDDGIYRSQWVTGISNGGLTAFPGGERDRWEERLFAGAYQRTGVTADERPIYGGLDLLGHPDGPCPRFGSCYLVLSPTVAPRTTYCFGDSHDDPADVATSETFDAVLAALVETVEATGSALGRPAVTVGELVASLAVHGPTPNVLGRAIDDYIEAQIHGPLRLEDDVDAVVADPSFRGSGAGRSLVELAERYHLDLRWHPGFALAPGAVPADLRGPAVPALARPNSSASIRSPPAPNRVATCRAARSVVVEPGRWVDQGSPAEVLQHLKQLWHVLVIRGEPVG
jgi:GNAT superfamily N-acetyltransferase